MMKRWTVVALLCSALPVVAQDPPEQAPAGPAAKPEDVTMTCKPPPARDKNPHLILSGNANFPDGTLLKVSIVRMFESLGSGRLNPTPEAGPAALTEVKGKKYSHTPTISNPGIYLVTVQLIDDFQKQSILDALKGKITKRVWQFQFPAWADDLVGQLGSKMADLSAIAKEASDIMTRVEKVAGSESSWVAEKKNVDFRGADIVLTKEAKEVMTETGKLMNKLDRSDAKILLPAAHAEIFLTLQTMIGNAQRFHWENGKFAGAKSYHNPTAPLPTHRDEPFNFENARKYLDEVASVAGREMGLWIVKDLRRTDGVLRPDILDALKTYGKQPGLDFISDRLSKATMPDLKAFEEELRGKLQVKKEEKKDDKPGDKPGDKKPADKGK